MDKKLPKQLAKDIILSTDVLLGLSVTRPKELVAMLVRKCQNVFLGEKLAAEFVGALNDLAQKGRVKPDYMNTVLGAERLELLLQELNRRDVDTNRFEAAKAVFIHAANDNDASPLPAEYMRIVSRLDAASLLTLKATYGLAVEASDREDLRVASPPEQQAPHNVGYGSLSDWLQVVGERSRLFNPQILERAEKLLSSEFLLGTRFGRDLTAVEIAENWRITPLGRDLCRYMLS